LAHTTQVDETRREDSRKKKETKGEGARKTQGKSGPLD